MKNSVNQAQVLKYSQICNTCSKEILAHSPSFWAERITEKGEPSAIVWTVCVECFHNPKITSVEEVLRGYERYTATERYIRKEVKMCLYDE